MINNVITEIIGYMKDTKIKCQYCCKKRINRLIKIIKNISIKL